uniref:aldo-keto reductase family 1 member D1-like n=1 Tax=Pristiophorus japonicus TaxID=55135 RepID=UPI00398E9D9E
MRSRSVQRLREENSEDILVEQDISSQLEKNVEWEGKDSVVVVHALPVGYLTTSPENCNWSPPGDAIYPKDENGKYFYHPTDLCATWEAMEMCKDAGLVKSIGVSNFNRRQLEQILNKPGLKYKPAVNQVECHPYFIQTKLNEFCDSHGIVIVGYSPLGTCRDSLWVNIEIPSLLDDPVLNSVATKYKKTSAQVALRYQLQRNIVVIPKSFNPERIKQNFEPLSAWDRLLEA